MKIPAVLPHARSKELQLQLLRQRRGGDVAATTRVCLEKIIPTNLICIAYFQSGCELVSLFLTENPPIRDVLWGFVSAHGRRTWFG